MDLASTLNQLVALKLTYCVNQGSYNDIVEASKAVLIPELSSVSASRSASSSEEMKTHSNPSSPALISSGSFRRSNVFSADNKTFPTSKSMNNSMTIDYDNQIFDPDHGDNMEINELDVTSLSFSDAIHQHPPAQYNAKVVKDSILTSAIAPTPVKSIVSASVLSTIGKVGEGAGIEATLNVASLAAGNKFLEEELSIWKNKYGLLEKANSGLRSEIMELQLSLVGADAQSTEQRSEMANLRETGNVTADKLQQVETKLLEMQEVISSQEKLLKETYNNLALLAKSEMQCKHELANSSSKCEKLRVDSERCYQECRVTSEELARLNSIIQNQKIQKSTLLEELSQSSANVALLEQNVRQLQSEKRTVENHITILTDKIQSQKLTIAELQQKVSEKDSQLVATNTQISSLDQMLYEVRLVSEKQQKEIENLTAKNADINRENENLRKDVDKHKDIITYINKLSSGQLPA